MKKSILLIIDNPYRELRGLLSIKLRLEQQGIPAVIASKHSCKLAFEMYQPSVIVLPRVTDNFYDFVKHASKTSMVCLIPGEHCAGIREKILFHIAKTNPQREILGRAAIDCVQKVFVPGKEQYQALLETGVFSEEQLCLSGTLNSDHWFLCEPEVKPKKDFTIGIATGNKSILFGSSIPSLAYVVKQHLPKSWEKGLWRADRAHYELVHMMILTDAIKQFLKEGYRVSLRPHPHEYLPNWQRFVRSFGDAPISIDRNLRIEKWLQSLSVVLTTFSTVAFDGVSHFVPSISLERILPARVFDGLPEVNRPYTPDFLWRPESLADLMTLLSRAKLGELPVCSNEGLMHEFREKYFYFPRAKLACDYVAEELAKLHGSEKAKTLPSLKLQSDLPGPLRRFSNGIKGLLRFFPFGKAFVMFVCDTVTYIRFPRRGNIYHVLQFSLRRDAKRYAEKLFHLNIRKQEHGKRPEQKLSQVHA